MQFLEKQWKKSENIEISNLVTTDKKKEVR